MVIDNVPRMFLGLVLLCSGCTVNVHPSAPAETTTSPASPTSIDIGRGYEITNIGDSNRFYGHAPTYDVPKIKTDNVGGEQFQAPAREYSPPSYQLDNVGTNTF